MRTNMKLLVTGGAGFVGSHLCEALLKLGHEVLALDNLYTGSLENIAPFRSNKNFTFIEHNVVDPISLEIDGIFNLACPASPVHYQRFPVETLKTSVIGAINMLDLARSRKVRILQSSTSEVYGDPTISPQPESYWGNVNPIGIRSCYDEGKRTAETLFFDFHREFKTDIRVARIFNTYGPRMAKNDGRVVSNFIIQALTSEALTIYGNGTQTRSLCYIDDLVEGLIKLFFSENIHVAVNLGNPQPLTMVELAKEIISLTGSKSELIFKTLPSDDPLQREPDISRARALLGWEPKINRNLGIQRTIDYFKTKV
jgi:UDP-glucuronate decarboxylase